MRKLLTLLALCAASAVHAAEPTAEERAKAALALDFCPGIVAAARNEYGTVVEQFPGLTLAEARAQDAGPLDEPALELFRGILRLEAGDELQFAAFDPDPSPRTLPFAVFQPGGDTCVVVGQRGQEGRATLATQLGAPGSAWTLSANDDQELWRKAAPFDEKIMLATAGDEALIMVALEQRPVATAAEITSTTHAAIQPCVEGALTATPPPFLAFEPAFKVIDSRRGEKSPDVVLTTLRSQVPGPRSMLTYNTFREFLYCEYWTSDARQTPAEVLAVVVAAIETMPGLKETKVKPAKVTDSDQPAPVLKSWRITRRGAASKADINVSIQRERVVVVTIEPASGWFQ